MEKFDLYISKIPEYEIFLGGRREELCVYLRDEVIRADALIDSLTKVKKIDAEDLALVLWVEKIAAQLEKAARANAALAISASNADSTKKTFVGEDMARNYLTLWQEAYASMAKKLSADEPNILEIDVSDTEGLITTHATAKEEVLTISASAADIRKDIFARVQQGLALGVAEADSFAEKYINAKNDLEIFEVFAGMMYTHVYNTEQNTLGLRSSASAVLSVYRELRDMDDLTLGYFDNMILEDVDFHEV